MRKTMLIACVLATLLVVTVQAQDGSGFSLRADPVLIFPLPSSPSAQRFDMGYQGSVLADYVLPSLPYVSVAGAFDYTYIPRTGGDRLLAIGGSAGAGLRLRILQPLSITMWSRGGYALGMLGTASAGTPYVRAGLDLDFYLTPSFRIGLGGEYDHFFAQSGPIFQGIGGKLTVGYNFSQANRKSKVEIRDILIQPVFPVFYKYYDTNTLGSVKIKNGEDGPIRDVVVTFYVKQYMDAAKECARIPEIAAGATRDVPLYALFDSAILGVLEPTKAQAVIAVSYRYSDRPAEMSVSASSAINHRNGMTWDDNRHVAAFVTMNDPGVLVFAKQVAGLVRGAGWAGFESAFREEAGVFEALALYGIHYIPDPNTPHQEYEKNTSAVDYLAFPNQTFQFRAGDCDDLSILNASLLEAAGVETAFVTVPGHIYIAFALDMSPEQARSFFYRPEDVIVWEDRVWVPVEVTAVQEGFLRAWQLGAREWREARDAGTAGFWPTHEAWKLYEPVAMSTGSSQVEVPSSDKILSRYQTALAAVSDREVQPREQKIKAEIAQAPKDPRPVNTLGVLYARYGQYDKAEAAFRNSIAVKENAPAISNLANILYSRKDFSNALKTYQRAQTLAPDSVNALRGLVLAAYETDDRDASSQWLKKLAQIDKTAADKLAFVNASDSTAARAGQAGEEELSWSE